MQNDDVVKILNKIRDKMDAEKIASFGVESGEAYNEAIVECMGIVEDTIKDLSRTPNQMKADAGMYHN